MILLRYSLWLAILIMQSISLSNQSESFLSKYNSFPRIKRFLFHKSSKARLNSEQILRGDLANPMLNDENLFTRTHQRKPLFKETKKGHATQSLTDIERILSKRENDYYGILGIAQNASKDVIIKAYKRLALLVHPDKINAPYATEAMQRLNKASAVLLQRFANKNQDFYQYATTVATTLIGTSFKSTAKSTEVNRRSHSISTIASLVPSIQKRTHKSESPSSTSHYPLLVSAMSVPSFGIIIFLAYWKKRQQFSTPKNFQNTFKKKNLLSTYEDGDADDDA